MKKFLINCSFFSLIVTLIFGCLLIWNIWIIRSLDFSYPSDIKYVFIGASHSAHSINDKIMTTAVNSSWGGERYLYTYLRLKKILEDNPQVDSVFIQVSPTDLWQNADDRYFSENKMSYFIPLYFPLFTKEEWLIFKDHKRIVLALILEKIINHNFMSKEELKEQYGRFIPKKENLNKFDRKNFKPIKRKGEYGNNINYKYLRKIINLCNESHVAIIGICYPLYHAECFYDLNFFYDSIDKYFSDLEFYDYRNFDLPDSLRFDSDHLNYYGSKIFTKEIISRFNIR